MGKRKNTEWVKQEIIKLQKEKEEMKQLVLEKELLEQTEIIKTIKRYMEVSKTLDDYNENRNFSNMEEMVDYVYFTNQLQVNVKSLYYYIGDFGRGGYLGMNKENARYSIYIDLGLYWIPDAPIYHNSCITFDLDEDSYSLPTKEQFEGEHNIVYIDTDKFFETKRNFLKLRAEFYEYLVEESKEYAVNKMVDKYGKNKNKVRRRK